MMGLLLLAHAAAMDMPAPARDPVCATAAIVPGFERWGRGDAIALGVGRSSSLALTDAAGVGYAPPLARPMTPGSFGGVFTLTIATAGTYRIALSSGAWLDVIRDGQRVASSAHMRGAACSGIAKIVAFALAPGAYQVQISEAKAPGITAMVAGG